MNPAGVPETDGAAILARLDRIPVWPWRYKLLWILGAAYFFAFYDIANIAAALPEIVRQFGVSNDAASWAISASLLGYIVGAWAIGTIADLWGRHPCLAVSVALFTLGSVGAALSPSLASLIPARFVAGLGIGAEIATVTTYLGEIAPAGVRGKYTSWANVCAFAGFAAVPFVARALVPSFAWGWRVMFLIGAGGGLTIFFIRLYLKESPRWLVAHGRLALADALVRAAERHARARIGRALPEPSVACAIAKPDRHPLRTLLRPPYRNRLLLLTSLWFCYYIGNYGWLGMVPDLLAHRGYSLTQSLNYWIASGVGFLVGAIASIWLNDRVERKHTLFAAGIVWVVALAVAGFNPYPIRIMTIGFVASTTIGLMVPILYTLTAEHFATGSRATGMAIANGLGHLGGALAPILVLLGDQRWGFLGALAVMAASGIIVLLFLPFTLSITGKALESAAGGDAREGSGPPVAGEAAAE